uniref:Uncharacterized protein n=1 Tax=Leersia perrieri TaxID=77586 RepID=A0A0D9X3D5_9ORYZ
MLQDLFSTSSKIQMLSQHFLNLAHPLDSPASIPSHTPMCPSLLSPRSRHLLLP